MNNNDDDRNVQTIINYSNTTKRVESSAFSSCGIKVVDSPSSIGYMTLSKIKAQDSTAGYQQGGMSAGCSKDMDHFVRDSSSFSHWTEPGVERTAGSQRSYYFVNKIVDKDIDNRSMSELANNQQFSFEEEEEEVTDTAPILTCTPRTITPNQVHARTSSKSKWTNSKHKAASCGAGVESKTSSGRIIADSYTGAAYLRNNNNRDDYNNKCMTTGSCAGGDPKYCDRSVSKCLHLPPPLISNHPSHNLHCCLQEPHNLITEELLAADVCFVKNGHLSSHRPASNLSISSAAAATGNYYYQSHEHFQNGSAASSSLLNPVSSSLLPTPSLFGPATNPSSAEVLSSNAKDDFVEVSEAGLKSGVEGGGSLPPHGGKSGPVPTTCSFASLSSSGTTSSSLPAWSSPHAMGEHCHPAKGSSNTHVDKLARNQLIAVSVVCVTFMTCEIVGGILSNSLALFTDVLHLGSDLISFFISLLALFLSTKPATESMSFGYHRIEVLGAIISVLLIWLVSGILCYIATQRIITENYKNVYPDEMLLTASLGVIFNVVMGFVLHSDFCCKSAAVKTHGHSHSHLHNGHSGANSQQKYHRLSQEPTENTPAIVECQSMSKPKRNVNIRAAIIHVMGDIIQSTGVLLAALIIKFTEIDKYKLADPICTFVFSIIVLCTTFNVLRDTICIIMEGVPHDINYKKIRSELETLDHVKMAHNLCVWSLTLNKNAVCVHLALDEVADTQTTLEAATAVLRQHHNFQHITIQVERYIPTMSQCPECLMPA